MAEEHVFVIGATGNVGSAAVNILLENGVRVTAYVRNPSKANSLFPSHQHLLTLVQGDYNDLAPFDQAMHTGHYTRLLLLVQVDRSDVTMAQLKSQLAATAYASGVEQVVDISSYCAGERWRCNFSADDHWQAEKALLELPGRKRLVCLRPGRFMSNIVNFDSHSIKHEHHYPGSYDPEETLAWVSPRDIGTAAARVLQDPIDKHGDSVYEMISQVMTPTSTAAVLSKVLGRSIPYVQYDPITRYNMLTQYAHLPHRVAYGIVEINENGIQNSRGLSILLGRDPETLEQYLTAHKHQFE
ncbi:unnamed protein product [Absidia cylindrospora]